MGLLSSPIKILSKTVHGFPSYDRTNTQTDIQRLELYIYRYRFHTLYYFLMMQNCPRRILHMKDMLEWHYQPHHVSNLYIKGTIDLFLSDSPFTYMTCLIQIGTSVSSEIGKLFRENFSFYWIPFVKKMRKIHFRKKVQYFVKKFLEILHFRWKPF